jgi:accessory gene regulator protein AgrB
MLKVLRWVGSFLNAFFKDLNKHRTILCWVFSIAYLVLIKYCVTSNPSTMNTAIMTTGGIVGTIFSAWVIGSSHVAATQIRYPVVVTPGSTGGTPTDMTDPGF